MPGADPNPVTSHLEDSSLHVTREELAQIVADLRAEIAALAATVAGLPGAKAADKPTR